MEFIAAMYIKMEPMMHLSLVENDVSNSVSGYVPADFNGDDFADASDLSIVENNAAIGVSAITP